MLRNAFERTPLWHVPPGMYTVIRTNYSRVKFAANVATNSTVLNTVAINRILLDVLYFWEVQTVTLSFRRTFVYVSSILHR